jgi:hypothetical protein
MKSINWKKFVFVMALSAIITHICLAYDGLIENYEAFVCALGYIVIGVLISSMLPDREETREKRSWWETEDDRLVRSVMDKMIEEKLGYKKETLEKTV